MDVSSFFDYPTMDVEERSHELVFLGGATAEDWAKILAHTETRRYRPGDFVIRAGETDRALYLLTEGTLEILLGGDDRTQGRFKTIEAPTVVGEQAFLDGGPRSGSLRALANAELLRLSFESFEALAAKEPALARDILFEIGRVLSQRLRASTDFIAEWIG